MKKNVKVLSKYFPNGQILKVRLFARIRGDDFTIWNISCALSKSNRQLNDWENKRKNRRCRSLSGKLTGSMGPAVFAHIMRFTRKFYAELAPGDSISFQCESCVCDKQYKIFKKWLLTKEEDPWVALDDVKGFFIHKPRPRKLFIDLYQELCL